MSNRLRVIHCPTNTGANPYGLSQAEKKLGLDSTCIVFEQTRFKYPCDDILFEAHDGLIQREKKRWSFLSRTLKQQPDLVHFNFGQKILPLPTRWHKSGDSLGTSFGRFCYSSYAHLVASWDLRLLKARGSRIAVTFQGDDIRQGDTARARYPVHFAHHVGPDYYDANTDDRKRQAIKLWDQYADSIFAVNPDLLRLLPARAKFMPYAHVRADEWPHRPPGEREIPIVVHAPTHRLVKGTGILLDCLQELRQEGVPFELRLIEGLSFDEAKRAYEEADLVVDQLLAGWFGGFSVEVMAMGKPVIAYLREEDFPFVPADYLHELPVINGRPDNLKEVLKGLLLSRSKLREFGEKGRSFVRKFHNPDEIAQFVLQECGLQPRI